MKSLKKVVATVLVMALCLTGVSYQNQTVKAADSDPVVILDERVETVAANDPYIKEFTLSSGGSVAFGVYTLEKVDFSYEILNSNGTTALEPYTISANDPYWLTDQDGYPYYAFALKAPAGGTYQLKLIFATEQKDVILLGVFSAESGQTGQTTTTPTATPVPPSLDFNNITVTKGFTTKISVANANGATLTYTSNNTKVATVDAKGVVTGKNTGSADITVKTSTGYTMTCKVTVKKNVYSTAQLSGKDVYSGVSVGVHNISYDKKGNLVIKAKMVNKSGYRARFLKNFKITIKNNAGKKIGVFSKKKMTVNLNNGKAKTYTFKIKKAKVKQKQDLRLISQAKVTGKYVYKR